MQIVTVLIKERFWLQKTEEPAERIKTNKVTCGVPNPNYLPMRRMGGSKMVKLSSPYSKVWNKALDQ